MPPIVMVFHARILNAMGGMIWCYAGPKGAPISDGRHNTRSRAPGSPSWTAQDCRVLRWHGLGPVKPRCAQIFIDGNTGRVDRRPTR